MVYPGLKVGNLGYVGWRLPVRLWLSSSSSHSFPISIVILSDLMKTFKISLVTYTPVCECYEESSVGIFIP